MAKDEISKKLEELKKYVERQKNADAPGMDFSCGETFSPDVYDENFFETVPESSRAGVSSVSHRRRRGKTPENINAKQPGAKKGCGCFPFIVIILILGIVAFAVFDNLKRGEKIKFSRKSGTNGIFSQVPDYSSNNAFETSSCDTVAGAASPDGCVEISIADMSAADCDGGSSAFVSDNGFRDELLERKERMERILADYAANEPRHGKFLPETVKSKKFASLEEKSGYFSRYYHSLLSSGEQAGGETVEAAKFYMNYSGIELACELISRELDDL